MSSTIRQPSGSNRVCGRLHLVQHGRDDESSFIGTVTGPPKVEFRLEDLDQLVVDACLMALPLSLTEQGWEGFKKVISGSFRDTGNQIKRRRI
jgi:hypothetical protein